MGSVLGLSGALWIKRREQKLFKTQLFLVYLTVLFFLSGLRFGLGVFADWNGPGITLFFELMERAAFASLIYFLPATINYLLGRRWTKGRLVQVLTLCPGLLSCLFWRRVALKYTASLFRPFHVLHRRGGCIGRNICRFFSTPPGSICPVRQISRLLLDRLQRIRAICLQAQGDDTWCIW